MLTIFLKLAVGVVLSAPSPHAGAAPNAVGLELRYALRELHRAHLAVVFHSCSARTFPVVIGQRRHSRAIRLVLEPMHSQAFGNLPKCTGPWKYVR